MGRGDRTEGLKWENQYRIIFHRSFIRYERFGILKLKIILRRKIKIERAIMEMTLGKLTKQILLSAWRRSGTRAGA